jgi:bifunctional non-homologous end joining protein LigD
MKGCSSVPARRASLPAYRPQLAQLVETAPTGPGWIHELKLDGYRIGCLKDRGSVTLLSRNGRDWTAQFPEIVAAAKTLPAKRLLLDGELVILLPDGRSSFQALQNAVAQEPPRPDLVYFAFDLLHLGEEDLHRSPLEARKERLAALLQRARGEAAHRIRYGAHLDGDGPEVFRHACRLGAEGIVSKRLGQPYRPGRNATWVKTKCVLRQELVIGGFTDPEGSRDGIGSLVVGYHDDRNRLRYAGKVGTGFTQAASRALRRRLEGLEQKASPFDPRPPGWLGRSAHWVSPTLVAEVLFTEWTRDGKIRHPSFQGLREDKGPPEVRRETPQRRTARDVVAGVSISHPDRMVYPQLRITKLQLARFYEALSDRILPHVQGRPLTLYRCPTGVGGEDGHFMKHSKVWAPDALRRVRIQEKTKLGEYLIADDAAALVALVQMDVVELHTWNSVYETLEQPNRIVLDLDPGPQVAWRDVVDAARTVRGVLRALRLESFVKTTGGVGLHVVVPLQPVADWKDCLAFSRAVAEALARQAPDRFTTAFAKAGRERKILLDYLRNNRTNTSVAAFSTRARPHAPVSVPLDWDELSPRRKSDAFTLKNLQRRLARLREDPWAGYWKCRQRLTKAALSALRAI